jgi:ABC-type multidrug transport system ATPase subunit
MDWHKGMWVSGRGFDWTDLKHYKSGHRGEFHFFIPSPLMLFGYLLFDMLAYAFLIWYFD